VARVVVSSPGNLGDSEVGYTFHTPNVEMHPLIKTLSRAAAALTFALVTHCLDDGDFGAFTIQQGKMRGKWLGGDWPTPFWERAAQKFNVPLDETWEDDFITAVAESWMRQGAMEIASGSRRRYDWGGGREYRDFEDERANAIRDLGLAIKEMQKQPATGRKPSRGSKASLRRKGLQGARSAGRERWRRFADYRRCIRARSSRRIS
jgi:hypothetical protein